MDGMIDTVKAHYSGDAGSNVADRARALLETLDPCVISPERLTALDHFHVRGAEATAELANLAGVQTGWTVLDAGSGLGGPSRHLAERYGCQVEGVDLTQPLSRWLSFSLSEPEWRNVSVTRWVMSPCFQLPCATPIRTMTRSGGR
ncbi:MAG TPA: hypothetical protein VGX94_06820 [Terriglobia bacterium]|nr:hypothetical protein [Terriglobia bacterium]